MGILILFVLTVGAGTIIYFVWKGVVMGLMGMIRKPVEITQTSVQQKMPKFGVSAKQPTQQARKREVYIDGNLVDWDILPKYAGETGWFGLPKYKDVIVGSNRCFTSEKYMDTAFKQYVYDFMSSIKEIDNNIHSKNRTMRREAKVGWFGVLFAPPFMMWVFTHGSIWGVIFGLVFPFLIFFVKSPYSAVCSRARAFRTKRLTPADWDDVDIEVMESLAREDEMVRAFRRSGVGYRHY